MLTIHAGVKQERRLPYILDLPSSSWHCPCLAVTTRTAISVNGRDFKFLAIFRKPFLQFSHLNMPSFQNSEFIWNVVLVGKQ